jgi:hypothetical protein
MATVTPSPRTLFFAGLTPAAPEALWGACPSGPLRCPFPARRAAAPSAEARLGRISR